MDVLIERYLMKYRQEIVDNVCALIQIPSVRLAAEPNLPYGIPCARALDFCSELAERKGLWVQNYDYRCIRAELPGTGQGREILFAAHTDVVAPDERGQFPPFAGVVRDGYIIGRGAVDDKAPLMAALYALAFFRQHNIPLHNRYALLAGSNEESGMDDIDYYLERAGQPDLALIVDDDFPVARGEPGLLRFSVTGRLGPDILKVWSKKQPQCLEPEQCQIIFHTREGKTEKQCFEKSALNPVVKLLKFCVKQGLHLFGERQDMELLRLVHAECPFCMLEDFQEHVDIIPTDLQMLENGRAVMRFRLYFSKNEAHVRRTVAEIVQGAGLYLEVEHSSGPCQLEESDVLVRTLTDLYNRETGTDFRPYIISRGITYARKFQYACGFGAGNPREKKPFPPGFGGTHGPDEAHSIRTLLHAVRIYIKAIWELDTKIFCG